MKRRTECCLNDADLCCSGVEPSKCAPVIHDEARADNIGSAVDCTSLHPTSTPAHPNRPSQSTHHEGHLEQTAELVLVLHAGLWVDEAALVGDGAIRADEDVVGDGLAEDLDLEDVRDDLLRLAVDVGVHERDVVVACDHVAES